MTSLDEAVERGKNELLKGHATFRGIIGEEQLAEWAEDNARRVLLAADWEEREAEIERFGAEIERLHGEYEKRLDELYAAEAENERLQQLPCPYIASSVEGTFYCKLAEATKNSPTGADSDLCDKLASAIDRVLRLIENPPAQAEPTLRLVGQLLADVQAEYHDQRGTG